MSRQDDTPIRRRPDGSIDVDFYMRRAALLRCTAQRTEPARWVGSLGRVVAKLAGAARMPHVPGSGPASLRRGR